MCIQECYRSVTARSVTKVLPSSFWSKSQSAWPVLSNCCRQPCPSVGMTFSPHPASSADHHSPGSLCDAQEDSLWALLHQELFWNDCTEPEKRWGEKKEEREEVMCILYHLSHQGSPWILEWAAFPFSRGSSWPRNQTGVSRVAAIFFTSWAIKEASQRLQNLIKEGLHSLNQIVTIWFMWINFMIISNKTK